VIRLQRKRYEIVAFIRNENVHPSKSELYHIGQSLVEMHSVTENGFKNLKKFFGTKKILKSYRNATLVFEKKFSGTKFAKIWNKKWPFRYCKKS